MKSLTIRILILLSLSLTDCATTRKLLNTIAAPPSSVGNTSNITNFQLSKGHVATGQTGANCSSSLHNVSIHGNATKAASLNCTIGESDCASPTVVERNGAASRDHLNCRSLQGNVINVENRTQLLCNDCLEGRYCMSENFFFIFPQTLSQLKFRRTLIAKLFRHFLKVFS